MKIDRKEIFPTMLTVVMALFLCWVVWKLSQQEDKPVEPMPKVSPKDVYLVSNPTSCLYADIMILADFSSSVRNEEIFLMEAMLTFTSMFENSAGVRIGIVTFNEGATLQTGLTNDITKLRTSIISIGDPKGMTAMDAGLQMASTELMLNGRHEVNQIIILISDGEASDKEKALASALQARMTGIKICSILVYGSTNDIELMKEISNGCYAESEYVMLAREIKKIQPCL